MYTRARYIFSRLRLLAVMCLAIGALSVAAPAISVQATANGYHVNINYAQQNYCDQTDTAVWLHYWWYVPPTETFTRTEGFNGQIVFAPPTDGTVARAVQKDGQQGNNGTYSSPTSPYTYYWQWVWAGGVNETIRVTIQCNPPYPNWNGKVRVTTTQN